MEELKQLSDIELMSRKVELEQTIAQMEQALRATNSEIIQRVKKHRETPVQEISDKKE